MKEKPKGDGKRLTDEQKTRLVALRNEDPKTWSYTRLGYEFKCGVRVPKLEVMPWVK